MNEEKVPDGRVFQSGMTPPPPVGPPELPHQECCQCHRTCREYEGVYLCLLRDGWPGIDRALRCTEWPSRYISRSLSRTDWQRTSSSADTLHLRPSHRENNTCVHVQVWKNYQFSEKVVVLMLVKEVGFDKKAVWDVMDRKGWETVQARTTSDFDAV